MRVVTDDFGSFLVDGPDRGEYLVLIEKDGYGPRQWGPVKIKDPADPLHLALFFEPEGVIWW